MMKCLLCFSTLVFLLQAFKESLTSNKDGIRWKENFVQGYFKCSQKNTVALPTVTTTECRQVFNATFGRSCYMVVDEPMVNLDDARRQCKDMSSHLIFVETEEENNFALRNLRSSGHQYWIGANGNQTNLYWDDNTEIDYYNFSNNSFDENTGCFRMRMEKGKLKWFDRACSSNYSYICEYEL